jgi:hypothetical protein
VTSTDQAHIKYCISGAQRELPNYILFHVFTEISQVVIRVQVPGHGPYKTTISDSNLEGSS